VQTFHSHFPGSSLTCNGQYLSGFKNPVAFPIFIYLVPPAEAHHESPGYVLGEMDRRTLSTPEGKKVIVFSLMNKIKVSLC